MLESLGHQTIWIDLVDIDQWSYYSVFIVAYPKPNAVFARSGRTGHRGHLVPTAEAAASG